MRPRGGFTLIELAIVLVLAGIAASMVLPRLDLSAIRLDSAERQVGIAVAAAQQRALTRQYDVHVRFDTAAARILVHEDPDNDGLLDPGEREQVFPLEEGTAFGRGAAVAGPPGPDAVSFREDARGLPTLTFHRSGSASEAGGFYLRRGDGKTGPGQVRAVTVERATGRLIHYYNTGNAWQRRGGP